MMKALGPRTILKYPRPFKSYLFHWCQRIASMIIHPTYMSNANRTRFWLSSVQKFQMPIMNSVSRVLVVSSRVAFKVHQRTLTSEVKFTAAVSV